MQKIKSAVSYFKRNGLKRTLIRLKEKIYEITFKRKEEQKEQENYLEWIKNNEPSIEDLDSQKNHLFDYQPVISILVPMYNTKERYFLELVESLKNQTYSNWQLCLADGSEIKAGFIDNIIKNDSRIIYKLLGENKGISSNTNEALKLATGDYYALLDHDDIIPPFSLYEVVDVINKDLEAEFIYSDEDKLMEYKEKRMGPHFKSDFGPDTLRSYNYICHFSIFKKSLMDRLKGFNSEFDGSQDYDIILRACENANKIVHIPKILYHWRINENSVALSSSAKPYAYEAAKKAISASLKRQDIDAIVEDSFILGLYRIKYKLKGSPKVSIIILNKDHKLDLEKCINSILKSKYENFEIIIVENNSKEKEIFKYYDLLKENNKIKILINNQKEFNFSELNNYGVENSTGEYLLFLNNDVEIITEEYLEIMIATCQRKDVGAIGAKLLYPDGKIQHAGVVLNYTGVAGHVNLNLRNTDVGYFGRTIIQQNFNAVTGAMMMISKENFKEVNGFDENLAVAYNDIDICLKLRELNKVNVFDPYIIAYHFESKTRGYEIDEMKKERLQKESNILKEKWPDFFWKSDEYFNINFRNDVSSMKINPNKINY